MSKPCVFCGSTNTRVDNISAEYGDGWKICCQLCHAEGPMKYTSSGAEEAWDDRRNDARMELTTRNTLKNMVEDAKEDTSLSLYEVGEDFMVELSPTDHPRIQLNANGKWELEV